MSTTLIYQSVSTLQLSVDRWGPLDRMHLACGGDSGSCEARSITRGVDKQIPPCCLSVESSVSGFGASLSPSLPKVFPPGGQRARNGDTTACCALGNLTLLVKVPWGLLPVLSPCAWILKTHAIHEPNTISGLTVVEFKKETELDRG